LKNIWKISSIILFLLVSVLFLEGGYPSRIYNRLFPDNQISSTYYDRQKSLFEKYDHKNKIMFVGDSITDECEWNELLGRNDIINRGIIGDTTSGVLQRLDLYLSQKPKSIFIMIGINDISKNRRVDAIKKNYSKIIDKILSNNVSLFIQSTLNTRNIERNKKVEILNNYLVEQCKLLSITYIDINSKLLDNDDLLSEKYSNDGVHLNGEGYIIWKNILLPYISKTDS
jgi:lysophospholipase L1-like esterase